MIKVQIPNNNLSERNYAVKMLLDNFIGINYRVEETDNIDSTIFSWDNKVLEFSDILWNNKKEMEYFSVDNLPQPLYVKSAYAIEGNLPVIYGCGRIEVHENKIRCDIDVLASVFFMLSRWEEIVVDKKDKHDRFIGKESIAYKNNFLNRPIVNEYAEFVWNLLCHLGYEGNRKNTRFELVLTHDIDRPFMKMRFLRTTKHILSSILNHDFGSIHYSIKNYFRDPFDTYSFFMDVSESINIKSRFYFMSSDPTIENYRKSPYIGGRFNKIINGIKERGHIIGFHPGYFSTDDNTWKREKEELERILGSSVFEGRQHFLRVSVPKTFEIWEKNNMRVDSSLSYADVEGFRCGTGNEFPVFNILKRQEYILRERPLIIMDGTLTGYQGYSIEEIPGIFEYYINTGKKYKMPITILFHNSFFLGKEGELFKQIYKDLVMYYKQLYLYKRAVS